MFPASTRTIAFVGAFLAIAILERLLPMYLEKRSWRHDIRNLSLGTLNTCVLLVLFAPLWVAVMDLSTHHRFGVLHRVDLSPVWHLSIAVLLFDCWQYWWHRINHRIPLLWRFHAVHHADALMDTSTAVRFHTGEIALSALARLAVLPLIGVQPAHLLLYESMLLPVILFHHSNTRISNPADRLLRWLIATPWMHWVHHSRVREETDSNYSSFFSIWDRIFGTFRLNAEPASIVLGLEGFDDPDTQSMKGTLSTPFRKHLFRPEIKNGRQSQT